MKDHNDRKLREKDSDRKGEFQKGRKRGQDHPDRGGRSPGAEAA